MLVIPLESFVMSLVLSAFISIPNASDALSSPSAKRFSSCSSPAKA